MERAPHTYRFVVDAAHHGLRIDTFLSARLRNHAAARMQRLAAAGLVTVDDGPCPADRRMLRGEEVVVRLAEPPEPFYPAEPIALEVLYDDPWLVAVNKPAGLIMHPAGPVERTTLANAVQALFDGQTRLPGLLRPGIVHRLDRETSGVTIVAKDATAHAGLTRQFERSEVSKAYVALVAGRVREDEGIIDRPIGQRPGSLMMSAAGDAISPRSAVTRFRVIERFRSATLVEARPLTGRKHQIRVHFAAMGHAVLGDAGYGARVEDRGGRIEEGGDAAARRHALHAVEIGFRHPVTGAALRVVAAVPGDFWGVLGERRA